MSFHARAGRLQCRVPQLAVLALASREGFPQLSQIFRNQPWHVWQGFEASNWLVPAAYVSERTSGVHQKIGKPDGNYCNVFPWYLQIKVHV